MIISLITTVHLVSIKNNMNIHCRCFFKLGRLSMSRKTSRQLTTDWWIFLTAKRDSVIILRHCAHCKSTYYHYNVLFTLSFHLVFITQRSHKAMPLHCVPKKSCDHVFDDKLNQNSPFTTIFGTLITKGIGHRRVFLFSRLTYFLHRLYLGKLSRPKYQ